MMNLTMDMFKVTKECFDWCSDQQLVHFGREFLIIPAFILISSIAALLLYESQDYLSEEYLPGALRIKIFMGLLKANIVFGILFFVYFYFTYIR